MNKYGILSIVSSTESLYFTFISKKNHSISFVGPIILDRRICCAQPGKYKVVAFVGSVSNDVILTDRQHQ